MLLQKTDRKSNIAYNETTERKDVLRDFFTRVKPNAQLDAQIDAVMEEMTRIGVSSEEYPNLLRHLERLNEIKVKERRDPVSPDTVAVIFGNLMVTFVIVAYERAHVTTSKGWNQLIRQR